MNEIINFLKKRRSVTAKTMNDGHVRLDHLHEILECGLRVPDHGALNPWKITVIQGEAKKRIGTENGKRIKRMIAEGTFTPNITNSWARSRCNINLNGNNIKLRSSWEAYFQLHNPTYKYEALRIPYKYKDVWYNYIIDFIDDNGKCIYEIKPISESNKGKIKAKRNAAIKWAQNNQYNYIEINEEWFKHNYDESLIIGQPDEERLKRLLKQFI